MGVKYTNNAETTLASAISSTSATSVTVASSSTFPSLSGSDYFYATLELADASAREVVKVTAVSGTTWTVVRGQDDTTARTFAVDDKVELRLNAALLTDVVNDAMSDAFTRQAFTGDGSETDFTLSKAPASENDLIVFIEGVFQTQSAYSVSGTTLTFSSAPADTREIIVYSITAAVNGDSLSQNNFTSNGNSGSGGTVYTLSVDPLHENNTMVFLDGVYQNKSTYTVSGTTLTLDAAPTSGVIVECITHTQTEVNTPATNSVVTASIVDANVTTAKIADDAVTAAKLASSAVVTASIVDDNITQAKIADDAVGPDQLASSSVVTASVVDDAITTAKIADDQITAAKIADNSITNALMADDAIDSAEIANGAIDLAHMSANSIDSDQYVDGSIDTAHLADDQITLAKMAGLARGKIIYGDSSGNPAALSPGSNGQVLKSDGTDISWGTDATVAALTSEEVQDITGAQIVTNGSHTGITASYDDAGDGAIDLVVGTLNQNTTGTAANLSGTPNISVGTIDSGNITTTGYLAGPASFTIDPATVGDNTGTVVIAGNLQVDGTTTTINSTTVSIDDLNFSIATDAADSAAANGAGITIGGASATMLYTHATTSFDFNKPINITGTLGVTGASTLGTTRVNGDFRVGAASGEDLLVIAPQSAGSGTIVISYNNAENAYEPYRVDAENFSFRPSGTEVLGLTGSDASFSAHILAKGGHEVRAYRSGDSAYGSMFMDTGENLYFRNSYANKDLVFDRDGKLGIGTNDPSTILHLKEAGSTSAVNEFLRLENSAGGGSGAGSSINFHHYHAGGGPAGGAKAASITAQNTDSWAGGTPSGYSTGLTFGTIHANTFAERMRISSDGKVGIGSSPSNFTAEYLNITTPASGGGQGISFKRLDSNSDQQVGSIRFANNSTDDLSIIKVITDGANTSSRMHLQTNSGSGLIDTLVLQSSGYVDMVGASDLRLTLGSQGTAGNNDSNWIRGTGTVLMYNSASDDHRWEIGGTEAMRLDANPSASVGHLQLKAYYPWIDLIAPDSGTFKAGITARGGSSSTQAQFHLHIARDASYKKISTASDYDTYLTTDTSSSGYGNLIFGTRLVERMRIDTTGRVGINRTPAITNCKLEIGGADNVNLMAVEASGRTFGLGVVGGSGSSRGGKIFINTSLWCTANVEGNTSYTPDGLFGGTATPTSISSTGSGSFKIGYKDNGSGLYSAAIGLAYDAIDGLSNTSYVDGFVMRDTGNSTTHLVIETDGDIKNTNNSYGSISDERVKTAIADASSQWNDVKALKVRKYKLATQPAPYKDQFQIGVIAQELEAAGMNGLVKESDPDTKHLEYNPDLVGEKIKSVKYSVLYMKALKALQEAMTRIETLEAKVATLESE